MLNFSELFSGVQNSQSPIEKN